jgi:hypothetical protein
MPSARLERVRGLCAARSNFDDVHPSVTTGRGSIETPLGPDTLYGPSLTRLGIVTYLDDARVYKRISASGRCITSTGGGYTTAFHLGDDGPCQDPKRSEAKCADHCYAHHIGPCFGGRPAMSGEFWRFPLVLARRERLTRVAVVLAAHTLFLSAIMAVAFAFVS